MGTCVPPYKLIPKRYYTYLLRCGKGLESPKPKKGLTMPQKSEREKGSQGSQGYRD